MAKTGNGHSAGSVPTRFGQPLGNPPGRPPGRKTRLQFQVAFISDLAEAWAELGKGALKNMAREDPTKFVQVCASLQPRQLEADIDIVGPDLPDDVLDALIDDVRARLAQRQVKLIEAEAVDGDRQD